MAVQQSSARSGVNTNGRAHRHRTALRSLRIATLLVGGIVLSAATMPGNESFLQPMGPVAEEQATHLLRVIAITMIVILPVLIGVPIILWRYRYHQGKGVYAPEWEKSEKLEALMWGAPLLIVIALSSWLWHSTAKLDPYKPLGPDPLQVQVIGLDWKWLFIYPDEGIATVNELVIPVDRPVELTLTTDTVMQSFLIAPLAGQIYAMPGMTTKLNLMATRKGDAEGENTQYNGEGFGRQKFVMRAVDERNYRIWVEQGQNAAALDEGTYETLRRPSVLADARADLGLSPSAKPLAFRIVDPVMFETVVARYHSGPAVDGGER